MQLNWLVKGSLIERVGRAVKYVLCKRLRGYERENFYQLHITRLINQMRQRHPQRRHPLMGQFAIQLAINSGAKRIQLFAFTGYKRHDEPYGHWGHNPEEQKGWVKGLLDDGILEIDEYSWRYFDDSSG